MLCPRAPHEVSLSCSWETRAASKSFPFEALQGSPLQAKGFQLFSAGPCLQSFQALSLLLGKSRVFLLDALPGLGGHSPSSPSLCAPCRCVPSGVLLGYSLSTCGPPRFFSAIVNHSCSCPFAVYAASAPSGLFALSTDMWFAWLLRERTPKENQGSFL